MTNFYTVAHLYKGKVLLRGWDNGKRVHEKIAYKPYLFFRCDDELCNTDFTTLKGEKLYKKQFDSVYKARDFLREVSEADNSEIYGMTSFLYPYLNDEYPGHVEFDPSLVNVVSIDIEVDSSDGFPEPDVADKVITAITLRCRGKTYTFGYFGYTPKIPKAKFFLCSDEEDLIQNFLATWEYLDPDVITGWNCDMFDLKYLYNRMVKIVGEDDAKRLSPWRIVEEREIVRGKTTADSKFANRTDTVYVIYGIATLDYLQLYKKFSGKSQETYRLDYIAEVELGEKKLDYSEYKSLHDLYIKNPEKFYDYNIHDAVLVDKLEEKQGFIQLVLTMAYRAKVNYADTLTTVTQWDVLIHNFLWEKKIVVSPKLSNQATAAKGAFVMDPVPGMYKWVVNFDFASLYPLLMWTLNISPEMYAGKYSPEISIDELLKRTFDNTDIVAANIGLAANMSTYDNSKIGFIPEIISTIFNERIIYREKMKEAKQDLEFVKRELHKRNLKIENL